MVQFFDSIPEKHIPWILNQKIFWVATAPLNPEGHINVSPKGVVGSFHIINPNKVWYEDLSGSGVETISHVRENKRITVMFNAFEGLPNILRMFGKGIVHEFGTPEYNELIPPEKRLPGSRSAIVIDIYQVSTSCGYAVPYFSYSSERTTLTQVMAKRDNQDKEAEENSRDPAACKVEGGIKAYWDLKNAESLDGLPGLTTASTSSFFLTGYGVPGAIQQTGKVDTVSGSNFAELGDLKLFIGFIIGALVTSLCFKAIV